MPVLRVLLLLPSCSWEALARVLLAVLPRWEPYAVAGASQRSRPNKLVVCPLDLDLEAWCCAGNMDASIRPLFFSHRGDGVGEWWRKALLRSAWRGAAAIYGVHQLRRCFASVILGHRDRSVLRCYCHCSVFNLLAGVPMRRPFSFSVAALNAGSSPSGFVPGGGAGGRGVESFVLLGGEGPDCFPNFLFSVLFVKVEDYAIISLLFEVLYVSFMPTD